VPELRGEGVNTVYRIQNKKGRGPFMPGFSHKWLDEKKDNELLLPPWNVEFKDLNLIIMPGIYYGCGCDSKEQLKGWFTLSEYSKLKEFGFNAVMLKVDKILAKSSVQCVFRRSKPLFKGAAVMQLYEEILRGAS
jgi:hypothetical protein